MKYEIRDNQGVVVNTIVSSAEFAHAYAKSMGGQAIPTVDPEPEEDISAEPTETEQLRADIDYLAIMTGVEL